MGEALALQSSAKSKAAANRAIKSLDIQHIKRALFNLSATVETIKGREALGTQRESELAIKKLQSIIDQLGISAADITGSSKPRTNGKRATGPKKGNKVAPKCQIALDGTTHQWTRRGRSCVVFRSHFENGGPLDDRFI